MKVLFLTVGDNSTASTRSRVLGYLPYLEKRGIGYKVLRFTSQGKIKRIIWFKRDNLAQLFFEGLYKIFVLAKLIFFTPAFDVILIQKAVLPKPVLKVIKALNKRVIFDFDDSVQLYNDITHMLEKASCVIVSNSYLRSYASGLNKNVRELISPVSVNGETAVKDKERLALGWIGSPETTGYLFPLVPVFKKLKENFKNLDIEFMGASKNAAFDSLGINVTDWSLEGQDGFLERIDVGIMPLENNEWSRSKAGYKLLIYMSKGIACVASPVGINTEIIEDGKTGFLVTSNEEWFDKISMLLNDAKLRNDMSERGRQRVKEHFSYDKLFPRFLDTLYSVKSA